MSLRSTRRPDLARATDADLRAALAGLHARFASLDLARVQRAAVYRLRRQIGAVSAELQRRGLEAAA